MAFESTKSRIVLFGGLTRFAPAGDPSLAEALLGDTWVHNEPGGAPPVPVVVELAAVTNTGPHELLRGGSLTVGFSLSSPAPSSGLTVINKVEAVAVPGDPPPPSQLAQIQVPLNVSVGAGAAGGTFNIVRGPGFISRGTYGIRVAVEAGPGLPDPGQLATFTVEEGN
jgi:hypothetical protein